jgi:hypothetical protein
MRIVPEWHDVLEDQQSISARPTNGDFPLDQTPAGIISCPSQPFFAVSVGNRPQSMGVCSPAAVHDPTRKTPGASLHKAAHKSNIRTPESQRNGTHRLRIHLDGRVGSVQPSSPPKHILVLYRGKTPLTGMPPCQAGRALALRRDEC